MTLSKAELVQQYTAALKTALGSGALQRGKTTAAPLVKAILNELLTAEAKLTGAGGNRTVTGGRSDKQVAFDIALQAFGAERLPGQSRITNLHVPTASKLPPASSSTPPPAEESEADPSAWLMLPA